MFKNKTHRKTRTTPIHIMTVILTIILLLIIPIQAIKATGNQETRIDSFIVYYGTLDEDVIKKIPRTTLIILSPLEDPAKIAEKTNMTIGYLSITTIGGWEPWAKNVTKDMIIGEYKEWGEPIINVSDPRWHDIILETAIPYILEKGFDGIMLDNLDQVEIYPEIREALIQLIMEIREEYPNLIIIVNRGFNITSEISGYIDGLLFEDYGSYYDMNKHEYKPYTNGDLQYINLTLKKIEKIAQEKGFYILGLAYGEPDDPSWQTILSTICMLDKPYGNPIYIGDAYLQKIGIVNPCTQTTTTIQETLEENTGTQKTNLIIVVLLVTCITGFIVYRRLASSKE